MRRILLTTVLLGAGLAPGVALAQQQPTNGAGLRYLSWPGKAAVAARPATAPAPAIDAAPEGARPVPTRAAASTASLPLARIAPAPIPTSTSRGLTPASAWLAPAPRAAEPQPQPQPQPQTQPHALAEPTPHQPAAAAPSAPAPAPQARVQPQPAPEPAPAEPAPVQAAVADPMAPRRDAPIFRLQRPDGATAAAPETGAAPSAQSARYYSVHRQAGHEPDAIRTPTPVYLDALPVQMAQTPTSADLAQPDGPPALVRNTDGSVRALPQTQADDLP